jgi:hypothetical protein
MRKRTPKPPRRWVGPFYALGAILLALDAKREMEAARPGQAATRQETGT